MSYAIFRVAPINTLRDLGQIGAHNQREKEAYISNPDIDITASEYNIQLHNVGGSYYEKYMKMVKPYKTQHEKKQKTIREDRKKSFSKMLDDSNSVIADELLFTSDRQFFERQLGMNTDSIEKWAKTCMEFVYEDMGYSKEHILDAVVHLDEKTPHLHVVVVPLIKKFDKRSNEDKWTISKKQFMGDKLRLSILQDKYHERMVNAGYNLDRGIKNSDNEHIDIRQYKKITRKLNLELDSKSKKLDTAMEDLDNKMSSNKDLMFDKEYVKVKKDTFDSMNKVIKETKKIMELKPKIQKVYDDVNAYANSYKTLERQKDNVTREVEILRFKNQKLENENRRLTDYIKTILNLVKKFFRNMLKFGNKDVQDETTYEVKEFYINKDFNKDDIYDIAVNTDKEDELFDYADIENNYTKDKDDYDIGM